MTGSAERDVVVAVFRKRSDLQRALATDTAAATSIELMASEAVVVTKDADGTLSISHSEHSPKKSLAVMTAKLMVAVPLGFYGVLAVTTAGLEVSAAKRDRGAPSDVDEDDLAFLVARMEPGWSAVLAAYPERQVGRAVDAFERLGAVMVWHAPESRIESIVRDGEVDG